LRWRSLRSGLSLSLLAQFPAPLGADKLLTPALER
jgi:hypothetical protein